MAQAGKNTDTEAGRLAGRQPDGQSDNEAVDASGRQRQAVTHRGTHTPMQTDNKQRQADNTHKECAKKRGRHTGRQADIRQAGRKINRKCRQPYTQQMMPCNNVAYWHQPRILNIIQ